MTTIIAGSFQQQDAAQRAVAELANAGFSADQMAKFFVNPPGQHASFPIGGDENESPGTENAPRGSAAGAAVGGGVGVAVGLAAMPVLGPAAPIAGAGVGAYVGSLYGALGNTDDKLSTETHDEREERHHRDFTRKSGMLVAVAAPVSSQQSAAIRILRANGAVELESADGSIVGGDWTDFDPLAPVNPVSG